jgi:23S rRNA pseudouridine1911/1915/1917 synthase
MEKAYKILANQEGISNKKAKELIDAKLVYVGDKNIKIARALMSEDTKFRVERVKDIDIIHEDENLIAVNKPALIDSYRVADNFFETKLIHRLDRETSGVMLLSKREEFRQKAIDEFKARRVKKIYLAWVDGIFFEEIVINNPISTFKRCGKLFSKIDRKKGKEAITIVRPILIQGKKSKVEIEIETGRTHQIRVHLSSIGYPIIGDELYGSPTKSKRLLLHAESISILNYNLKAKEPKDILKYK